MVFYSIVFLSLYIFEFVAPYIVHVPFCTLKTAVKDSQKPVFSYILLAREHFYVSPCLAKAILYFQTYVHMYM